MDSPTDDGVHTPPQFPQQPNTMGTPIAPPPAQAHHGWRTRYTVAIACGAAAGALLIGGAATFGIIGVTGVLSDAYTSTQAGQAGSGSSGSQSAAGGQQNGSGQQNRYGFGDGSGSGDSGSQSDSSLTSATTAQQVGVVDISSLLGYDSAEAEGTGLVLTSDGEILTNNHVIEDATSIKVTIVSTGASYNAAVLSPGQAGSGYTATVVGTDATDDIAVLKLSDVSGLATAKLDTKSTVTVGQQVTGVGNAGGVGGTPSAAVGAVTALDQSITTQAEETAKSETLSGLIETNADIQAGDSGGPLFDNDNEVIGIDTAASQGSSTPEGYAIPITTALSIATKIVNGEASASIVIGYPAFLGVEVAASTDEGGAESTAGAQVAQVIPQTPAASAGLQAGDTITAVNGTAVASADSLTATLAGYKSGQTITITWADVQGASHSAQVTLIDGPAA